MTTAPSRSSIGKRNKPSQEEAYTVRCQEVLKSLRKIIRATDVHSRLVAKKSGLTVPQVVLLQSIRDLGEVTTRQLAQSASLSQATVTAILDRLDSRGMVVRYRSTADRRIVHARLTDKGRQALKDVPALLQDRFITAYSKLSVAEQNSIARTLERIAAMMGAEGLDAAPLLDVGAPLAAPSTVMPALRNRAAHRGATSV